jgi:uncharacterized protein YidB (DUF937 family)
MGLLDQIIGELPQEHASTGEGGVPTAILDLLANEQVGGLNGLMGRFAQAGLGHVFESWVNSGPDQPVSTQDMHRALGDDQVQRLASQTGIPKSQLLSLLAQVPPCDLRSFGICHDAGAEA